MERHELITVLRLLTSGRVPFTALSHYLALAEKMIDFEWECLQGVAEERGPDMPGAVWNQALEVLCGYGLIKLQPNGPTLTAAGRLFTGMPE